MFLDARLALCLLMLQIVFRLHPLRPIRPLLLLSINARLLLDPRRLSYMRKFPDPAQPPRANTPRPHRQTGPL